MAPCARMVNALHLSTPSCSQRANEASRPGQIMWLSGFDSGTGGPPVWKWQYRSPSTCAPPAHDPGVSLSVAGMVRLSMCRLEAFGNQEGGGF